MPEMTKETSPTRNLFHGHTVVGTTRVQLAPRIEAYRGVMVRCPGTGEPNPNTKAVWIGGSAVTADSSPTGGIPIVPGAAMFIPVDDASLLYVVTNEDDEHPEDQDIAWIGV